MDAIFDEFHKFHKIRGYLYGHISIGLVLTLQIRVLYRYFMYLFFDYYYLNIAMTPMSDINADIHVSVFI